MVNHQHNDILPAIEQSSLLSFKKFIFIEEQNPNYTICSNILSVDKYSPLNC